VRSASTAIRILDQGTGDEAGRPFSETSVLPVAVDDHGRRGRRMTICLDVRAHLHRLAASSEDGATAEGVVANRGGGRGSAISMCWNDEQLVPPDGGVFCAEHPDKPPERSSTIPQDSPLHTGLDAQAVRDR